jgi:hypothetical protein
VVGAVATGTVQADEAEGKKLGAEDIVVHVPKGYAAKVKVQEGGDYSKAATVTVRVSSRRKPSATPVVGVIIK